MTTNRTLAEQIVAKVEFNLNDRRGLKWSNLDDEILDELRASMVAMVEGEISNAGSGDLSVHLRAARQALFDRTVELEQSEVNAALHEQQSRNQSNEADRLRAVVDEERGKTRTANSALSDACKQLTEARDAMSLALFLLVDSEQDEWCSRCKAELGPIARSNMHELRVVNPIDRRIVKFNQEAHTDNCQTAFAVTSLNEALSRLPL